MVESVMVAKSRLFIIFSMKERIVFVVEGFVGSKEKGKRRVLITAK